LWGKTPEAFYAVQGSGFRVQEFRVQEFRVQEFRVQGSEVQGSGFRSSGFRTDKGVRCQEFGLRPIGAGPTPRLPARRVQSLQLVEREVGPVVVR
jgi:hypothetical protein